MTFFLCTLFVYEVLGRSTDVGGRFTQDIFEYTGVVLVCMPAYESHKQKFFQSLLFTYIVVRIQKFNFSSYSSRTDQEYANSKYANQKCLSISEFLDSHLYTVLSDVFGSKSSLFFNITYINKSKFFIKISFPHNFTFFC